MNDMQTHPTTNGHRDDRSLAELSRDLTRQTTTLVRQEIELAKVELAQKGKQAGIGAGMFGGAGALGFYAFGALTAAAILGLAELVPGWAAALIVAALYGLGAGALALMGKGRVQQASPPVPEETVETLKEDVEWARTRAQQARHHA